MVISVDTLSLEHLTGNFGILCRKNPFLFVAWYILPSMPSISITLLWGATDGFVGFVEVRISAQEQGGHDGYVMAMLKYAPALMAMSAKRSWPWQLRGLGSKRQRGCAIAGLMRCWTMTQPRWHSYNGAVG
jgi:hypothetical protein